MNNKKTKILLITILAITAIAISGCVIRNQDEGERPEEVVKENEKPAISDDMEIDTSDWLTYRNEEYRYEMKYPKDWSVKENDEWIEFGVEKFHVKNIIFSNKDYYLLFSLSKKEENIKASKRTGTGAGDFIDKGKISIGGIDVNINELVYMDKIVEIFYDNDNHNEYVISVNFRPFVNDSYSSDFSLKDVKDVKVASSILKSLNFVK